MSSSPVVRGSTFHGNWALTGGDAVYVHGSDAHAAISRSILAFNRNIGAIGCCDSGTVTLSCSDVFGNAGGDWVGCIAGQDTINDNLSEDPMFCASDSGDFRIDLESLCAAVNSPCGFRIGAMDAIECATPVECWGLSATGTPDGIAITWHASLGAAASSFEVQRSTRFGDTFRVLDGTAQEIAPGAFNYLDDDVSYGLPYWYKVQGKGKLGWISLGPVSATQRQAPQTSRFDGSFPNPFNPSADLCFTLREKTSPTIRIFGVSGDLVREIRLGKLESGEHVVRWDGRDSRGHKLPSGVYFCRLITPGAVTSGKLVIVQ